MPVIHNDDTMICDYCLAEGKFCDIPVPQEKRYGEWWVLVQAESLGDPPPAIYTSLCLCRKCESRINEICRMHRYKLTKKLNSPEPEEPLLPEEDLPDTAFVDGLPNPDVACMGTCGREYEDQAPVPMRAHDPLWTKRPAPPEEDLADRIFKAVGPIGYTPTHAELDKIWEHIFRAVHGWVQPELRARRGITR